MSHIPGYILEDFLSDLYRVFDKSGNYGSDFARMWNKSTDGEIYGGYTFMSDSQFKEFVKLFEQIRKEIEDLLLDFDEENQSWRDYKYFVVADIIPDELDNKASKYLKSIKK